MNVIEYTAWHKEQAPKKYQTVYTVDTIKGPPLRFVNPIFEQNDKEVVFRVEMDDDQFAVTTINKAAIVTMAMKRELVK